MPDTTTRLPAALCTKIRGEYSAYPLKSGPGSITIDMHGVKVTVAADRPHPSDPLLAKSVRISLSGNEAVTATACRFGLLDAQGTGEFESQNDLFAVLARISVMAKNALGQGGAANERPKSR